MPVTRVEQERQATLAATYLNIARKQHELSKEHWNSGNFDLFRDARSTLVGALRTLQSYSHEARKTVGATSAVISALEPDADTTAATVTSYAIGQLAILESRCGTTTIALAQKAARARLQALIPSLKSHQERLPAGASDQGLSLLVTRIEQILAANQAPLQVQSGSQLKGDFHRPSEKYSNNAMKPQTPQASPLATGAPRNAATQARLDQYKASQARRAAELLRAKRAPEFSTDAQIQYLNDAQDRHLQKQQRRLKRMKQADRANSGA